MEELIIKVDVQGEENITAVDSKLNKVTETGKKTTNAFAQMRKEMRDAKADMLSFAEGTTEYNAAMQKAAASADKMRDMQDKIKASQKDIGVISKNVAGSISGLAGAFSTAQGAMALFGVENEDATKALLKVQAAMSVASGIAQMADSLDNIKDLYNAVKINIIAMVAAKQAETVATVENTAANAAEAVAITATGTAAKVTAKSLLLALGPYALIGAAIAAVAAGVTALIKKINEVPKDVKIKMELNTEVAEKMAAEYLKVRKFSDNYYNAVKAGDKERIKGLDEIGNKEFGLNDAQLKAIGTRKGAWAKAFDDYLANAKQAYLNEALYKREIDAKVEYEAAKANVEIQKQYIINLKKQQAAYEKENPGKSFFDKIANTGNVLVLDAAENKLNKLIEKVKETGLAYSDAAGMTSELYKATKDFGGSTTGGKTGGGKEKPEPVREKTREELLAELAAEGISERNEANKAKLQAEILAKRNGPTNAPGLTGKTSIDKLDVSSGMSTANDKGQQLLSTIAQIKPALGELAVEAESFGEKMTNFFGSDTMMESLDKAYSVLGSMQRINDSFIQMYDYRMQAVDNFYNAEENAINNSTDSEEEKNKKLAILDKKRYVEQKKLFEAQKKFQIASAWIQFASGSVAALAGGIRELGPIAGPIVGGLEIAALLATTIAQTKAIASQKMEAPTSGNGSDTGSSSSASSAISSAIALNPTTTAMKSKEENLNMLNNSGKNVPDTIVKVSDINKTQNTVKVRENNTNY